MEPTSKRAALEAWLTTAEEVLLEQRQHSISPSSVEGGRKVRHERNATLWEIEQGVASVLQRLLFDPGRWILILEDSRNSKRYLQFLAYEDGSLVAETTSNHYLAGDAQWASEDETTLRSLGWSEPEPPKRPNWLLVCPTLSPPVTEIAHLAAATLRQVFALDDWDRVVIKLLSSPLRGNTPACETHQKPGCADTLFLHSSGSGSCTPRNLTRRPRTPAGSLSESMRRSRNPT